MYFKIFLKTPVRSLLILFILSLFLFCYGTNTASNKGPLAATNNDFPAFARINDGSKAIHVIDFKEGWKFKATDENKWMDATVPGTVQEDLIKVGRLRDPYYRDNELDAQWVEKKEWEYQYSFNLDESILRRDMVFLDCRGLDVICELYLNNTLVANTQNMFIEYEFDVKEHLQVGINTLRVVFRSVLEWNKKQADEDPRVTWRSGDAVTNDALKGLLYYSRKEASDFGWDWGVRLLSSGIWKPIRLVAYDTGRIVQLDVRQDLSNINKADLYLNAELETYRSGEFAVDFEVMFEDSIIAHTIVPVSNGKAHCMISIPNPKIWWPNGWGEHPLYTVKAILLDKDIRVHTRQTKIGLRTVEIVREKDNRGETFGINVNGKLIFCKGSNWIPADAMPGRLTEGHYKHLLQSCVDANMNMIRVWGGGLYEADVFYDFCDENGILIWQDFMFASGPYLATKPYLENVKAEVKNVVLRRRHHPSIALWCGNNESEHNMGNGQNWIAHNPAINWTDYDKIFNEVIPQTAALYDPDRPYWPSSPHNPLDRDGKSPDYQEKSGNVHTYEVWGGEKRFDAYSEMGKYRFVSEFGFQSLPNIETIRSFTAPEDRYFSSSIMDYHNLTGRKPNQNQGNVRIATYTADRFRMPTNMENWITVSQILQGEGMKMGCEAMRQNYPHSTGALYWQLNDNWPVISWSSIDYFGRWKAVHYMAKRFFNPILVSGAVKKGRILVYGSNDLLKTEACTLKWELSQFDGTVLRSGTKESNLPANQSMLLETLDFSDLVNDDTSLSTYRKESYRNRENIFLSLRLEQGDSLLSSNMVFFVPPKYWNLEKPEIQYMINREQGETKIILTAKKYAAYVELGVHNSHAQFSDNYFHLLPGESKTVFVVSAEIPYKEFQSSFYAKSLIDTYSNF